MSKTIPVRLEVIRTEPIGSMQRVILGGSNFTTFWERVQALPRYTDLYAKLVFWPDGFDAPEHVDLKELPDGIYPTLRTYTIRAVDPAVQEVAIDFVVHGDEGFAGPWASNAQPGDVIHLRGPNGGYAPGNDVDHHLFVGDEAGLPAILASLEALTADDTATAFIEVDDSSAEVEFSTNAAVAVHWLHRGDAAPGTTTLLDDAVRAWPWPTGRVQAFIHGESALLKSVRPYVLTEQGVSRGDVSVSAYWRRGETEEGFRAWKKQQTDAVIRPTR